MALLIGFIINTSYVYKYHNVEIVFDKSEKLTINNKELNYYIYDDSIKIVDSYRFNKEERYQILTIIKKHLDYQDVEICRTINNMEAEWSLHNYLYNFGLFKESTKDVDLEFSEDGRWYVKSTTYLIQILGI